MYHLASTMDISTYGPILFLLATLLISLLAHQRAPKSYWQVSALIAITPTAGVWIFLLINNTYYFRAVSKSGEIVTQENTAAVLSVIIFFAALFTSMLAGYAIKIARRKSRANHT
jgi:flagellar motor component MotA